MEWAKSFPKTRSFPEIVDLVMKPKEMEKRSLVWEWWEK
jgi:hypothetical protein